MRLRAISQLQGRSRSRRLLQRARQWL